MQALAQHGSREAFVAGDRRLSYAQVRDLVSRFTSVLAARGVGLGTGVAMLSPNMPESWFVPAATYLLGGRFTGLQALASVNDHIVVCQDADITVLVVTAPFEEHGRQVLDQVDSLKHLVVIPAAGGLPDGEHHASRPLHPGPAAEDDVAWLQYTGGTTGRPRARTQPHRAMVYNVLNNMANHEQPRLPRFLAAAPLTHATCWARRVAHAAAWRHGRHRARLRTAPVPGRHRGERINCCSAIPTMVYALLDHERPETRDLSCLETVWTPPAPCPQ